MGILRSVPEKTVDCSLSDFASYFCVSGTTCGWQLFNEDFAFAFEYGEDVNVMGIFDGEGGPEVSEYCRDQVR